MLRTPIALFRGDCDGKLALVDWAAHLRSPKFGEDAVEITSYPKCERCRTCWCTVAILLKEADIFVKRQPAHGRPFAFVPCSETIPGFARERAPHGQNSCDSPLGRAIDGARSILQEV